MSRAQRRRERPYALQHDGVQVYFAPDIELGARVVDLRGGRIESFREGEARPQTGYHAELESLERYFRKHGLPLDEVVGWAIAEPHGRREAGDQRARASHGVRSSEKGPAAANPFIDVTNIILEGGGAPNDRRSTPGSSTA